MSQRIKQQARLLRQVRRLHRLTGIYLFLLMILMGASGLLLGWKKNSFGLLQAPTERGASQTLSTWLPMDTLARAAQRHLQEKMGKTVNTEVSRMDARPGKGIVKVIFENGYHEVQLDASTGAVLSTSRRYADLIEQLHDGSILDRWLGVSGGVFKRLYSSLTGVALVVFSLSGFWLWYGPRRMKSHRYRNRKTP